MNELYAYTVALGVTVGLLAGALSHCTWLIKLARDCTESGKTLSLARRAISLRITTFFLSLAVGAVAGFLSALVCYDRRDHLWVFICIAFVAGFALDLLVKRMINFKFV